MLLRSGKNLDKNLTVFIKSISMNDSKYFGIVLHNKKKAIIIKRRGVPFGKKVIIGCSYKAKILSENNTYYFLSLICD